MLHKLIKLHMTIQKQNEAKKTFGVLLMFYFTAHNVCEPFTGSVHNRNYG